MGSARGLLLCVAALAACAADATEPTTPTVAAPNIAVAADGSAAGGGFDIDADVAKRCLAEAAEGRCDDKQRQGCSAACKRGEAAACTLHGELMQDRGDAWCGSKLHQLACHNRSPRGCLQLAKSLGNNARAHRLLGKACDDGYGPACTERGEQYDNQPDAIKMFELGCDKGDVRGCKRAAQEYESGPERDPAKRVAQLRKGCELGDADMCIDEARALMFGVGVARDPVRGHQLLQQVCAGDGSDGGAACLLLAQVLSTSRGSAVSANEIAKLNARACEQGHFDGCLIVATEHYIQGRYEQAVAVATKLVEQNGRHADSRYRRGFSLFDLARFDEAANDLAVLIELRPQWHYGNLYHFAAVGRAGGDASAKLRADSKALDLEAWPGPVVSFYLGSVTAAQLLAKAKHPNSQKQLEQQCEAYFYIAQQHLIRGRTKEATRLLHKTVDTGLTNFLEHASARAELARLSAPPP